MINSEYCLFVLELGSACASGMHIRILIKCNDYMFACARCACNTCIDPNTFMHSHADRVVAPGMRSAIPKQGTSLSGVSL
jgi:hypothetical protein